MNFFDKIKNVLLNKNIKIEDNNNDNSLKHIPIDSDLLQEVIIQDVPPVIDISSPTVHRKILFKVPKTMVTFPTLKSITLNTVVDNFLIKDFQIEDSLDRETTTLPNPCSPTLPPIKGEYFLDNQYISCTVSYFASLIGEDDVVYAIEEDFLTIFPFLYCGYKTIPIPTIYDFEVVLSTPDDTLNPIGETEEYYLYEMMVDVKITLLPLIEINPSDSPLLPELNYELSKPDGNNKFTHGELAYLNNLQYFSFDINTTIFKDILKYFINLKYLTLDDCYYTAPFDEMFNLQNLVGLYLQNNNIISLNSKIGHLSNLKNLLMDHNNLTSLPDELSKLINLIKLDVSYNKLDSLPVNFDNLINLKSLSLSHNKFLSLPVSIGSLINLNELVLNNNELTFLPLELSNLVNLKYLHIASNKLNDIPTQICDLSNIIFLNLEGNNLTALPSEFVNLINLDNLNLSENEFISLPNEILSLYNLQFFQFAKNKLASIPTEFFDLTSLATLSFENNELTSLPLEFSNLVNLTNLDISNNHLSNLSILKGMGIMITAVDQSVDYGDLSDDYMGYMLNLDFLRDFDDLLPNIPTISNSGVMQNIGGIDYIIWHISMKGFTVNFTFDNDNSFRGTVSVNLV